MVIITAPIKGFLPKIKGGNCHIPISQNALLKAQFKRMQPEADAKGRKQVHRYIVQCNLDIVKNLVSRGSFTISTFFTIQMFVFKDDIGYHFTRNSKYYQI